MRGVAEVISQGQVLINLDLLGCVVQLLVLEEGAELVEVYVFVHGLGCQLCPLCAHLLLSHEKVHEAFVLHDLLKVIQVRCQFGLGVLLKDADECLAAVKDLEVIADLANAKRGVYF